MLRTTLLASLLAAGAAAAQVTLQEYPLPPRVGAHDVWADPAPDGPVWFSAQRSGHLGILDPKTGKVELIPLGERLVAARRDRRRRRRAVAHRRRPERDRARRSEDARGEEVAAARRERATRTSTPRSSIEKGIHWFTGQSGIYGRLDPRTGDMKVFDAPQGRGPYGIHATPDGVVYYASLAGSHIARIDAADVRTPR